MTSGRKQKLESQTRDFKCYSALSFYHAFRDVQNCRNIKKGTNVYENLSKNLFREVVLKNFKL